ncbi:ycf20-like protein [Salvia divinorum]|uniref:Ycf20-like protein n=1 Tax=Salvia divinorum TaxID=28513 RepID=A0ABD1IA37_SALDI
MANGASLTCTGLLEYGLIAKTSNRYVKWGTRFGSRSSASSFRVVAVQESEGPRRLVDIIRIIPDVSRNYFRSPSRRALFGGISLLGGFYVAQTISLSFGALGVNDVIAAVLCVLITEYVTRFYYSRPKITFPIALLNNFKMGFTYGLFIDAFKLAS